ncbi:glucuronate isomerase [Arachidicoccus ginsenosidimutans]|uniref:glucuronate isomerase n=1 Tax=Arachidicoccus sp. BS20 TaxID=1850526 RepID=UPI0007F083FB|nr:glucuronate isomerase [Arachidicoccus sp. BS20]ANI88393.1 glucuronate isomerase [Arachidicoccus sp. BS20]
MKTFLEKDFLLYSEEAKILYHEVAAKAPIIDYHNHLPPELIAKDYQFKNITEVWLGGDHYKWRAMRANGVDESYITGNKPDEEKFFQWAKTVPYTMRNPLYHWTHLELQRYFDIHDLLNERSARKVYETTSSSLQTKEYSVRNLLRKMNVAVICTTDDPCDSLEFHIQIKNDGFEIPVLPAFRPDAAMNAGNTRLLNDYVARLEKVTNTSVTGFKEYLAALKSRHDFFASVGCKVSDHGLEHLYAEDYTDTEIETIFDKIRIGKSISAEENAKFKSAMLVHFAEWDYEKNWVQQYHLGALRNNNIRLQELAGADVGADSIGDYSQGKSLSKFLGSLDARGVLTKTILYNLNPSDNELFATMAGNFNDGTVPGKIQYGAAWWFLDQKDGMEKQIATLSNMGLLSRFVGMLTDSRSFLSFPRHEYFRRILCNMFGDDIVNGELPNDMEWIKKIVGDICFNNAKSYFGWENII